MKLPKMLFLGYAVSIFFLLLYSYTQIDLSLTFSRWSVWQVIEKFFQYIGYFERPLSTALYSSLLLILFGFYAVFIRFAQLNRLKMSFFWKLILVTSVILFLSYNAFSYDFFNYIFDARIFTHYHLNPYFYKALDFPTDPMLSFMHWTHRVYPYGPIWLLATIPLSYLGLQFFLPTFFLFKFFTIGCFLAALYFLDKTLALVAPKDRIVGFVLFAFNPLVLIESLVSGHNDMFMMFLAICAFYLLAKKRYLRALILLLLSIGVKFATAFLLPVFLYVWWAQSAGKKFSWRIIFACSVGLMSIAVFLAAFRTTFQPWYILFALPFGAFLGKKYYIILPTVVLSFFLLLEYTPYLYTGNWNPPIPSILQGLTMSGIMFSLIVVIGRSIKDLFNTQKTV